MIAIKEFAMLTNFAFIDAFTQKIYVEHFGSRAIEDCPRIRENLMRLSGMVVSRELPYVGVRLVDSTLSEMDLECSMDTEIDDAVRNFSESDRQIIVESPSLEACDYLEDLTSHLQGMGIETVFVYGVPYEAVAELTLALKGRIDKVWVVVDAVKNTEGNERELVKGLSKQGVKNINTRNLEKYLDM